MGQRGNALFFFQHLFSVNPENRVAQVLVFSQEYSRMLNFYDGLNVFDIHLDRYPVIESYDLFFNILMHF